MDEIEHDFNELLETLRENKHNYSAEEYYETLQRMLRELEWELENGR